MSHAVCLYAGVPRAPIEIAEPAKIDPSCECCSLHEGVRTVCLKGEGEAGGLMLIGESPGRNEDACGRPFCGDSGRLLREKVGKLWSGPIVVDNACRCSPSKRDVTEKHVAACRGFLAETIREAQPRRIVTLGSWASFSLFGRSIPPLSTRRGYAYLFDVSDEPVPCFFVLHPAAALRNRFVRAWFEADLVWALTAEPPRPAPILGLVRVVDSLETARAAIEDLRGRLCAFDVETAGVLWNRSFRIEACSVAPVGERTASAWLWDRAAVRDPALRAELARYLEDEQAPKLGQNVKFDVNALRAAWGTVVRGVVGDTRLWRRMRDPEAGAKLDEMAELVGMGGMKIEARSAMKAIVDRVKAGVSAEKSIEKRKAADPAKKWPKLSGARAEGLAYLHEIDAADPELARVIREDPGTWERYAYALVDGEILARYNARDTIATARLGARLPSSVAEVPSLDRLRKIIVDRAAVAIAHVERWGVAADRAAIVAFDAFLGVKLDEVGKRIDAYGFDVNIDSPQQVARILFEVLKLRPPKFTDTGRASTDKEVLAELASKHPFARDLSEHRRLAKLRGTYAGSREGEGLWAHVREDGRIHTSILLDGASSGRTSSQEPNLQNVPIRTAEGKMVRDCFIAPLGCQLVQLDYCLDPRTKVLRSDLRWVDVATIEPGDELVGFDEQLGPSCKMRRSVVEVVRQLRRKRYRVVTDRGEVVASAMHGWVRAAHHGKVTRVWVPTHELERGDTLSFFADPWEVDKTWDGSRSWGRKSRPAVVLSVEELSEGKVIGIQTSTRTLVANGFLTHNSQLELRVAAMLSGDPEMIAIFQSGADYHQRTAELICKIAWGIPPEQLEKKHRFVAKTINFALLYGAGDAKIAEQIRTQSGVAIKAEDVAKIRIAILGKFRTFAQWADARLAESRRTGQAWTWWDGERARCRSLWRIADQGDDASGARITAEHSSVNTPIQGTGSDFCIASLVELVEWIEREGIEDAVKLVLPVHDSIMFECREDWTERVIEKARAVMTGWPSENVPLVVDVEVGRSWGSLAKWPPKPES